MRLLGGLKLRSSAARRPYATAWCVINRTLAVFYTGASVLLLKTACEDLNVWSMACALLLVALMANLAHAHFTYQPWATLNSAWILCGVLIGVVLQFLLLFFGKSPQVSRYAVGALACATFLALLNLWFARKLRLDLTRRRY